MKKSTENSISMFKTVKAVCDINPGNINSNAGLLSTYNQFVGLLDDVNALASEQTMKRTGITIDKQHKREELAQLLEVASGMIKAHADSVNNFDLFKSADITISRLRKMRDQLIIAHGNNLLQILTDHQAELAPFGVDAAYLASFAAKINEYIDIAAKPTIARNTKSMATEMLQDKVRNISVFLKNELDNAMFVIRHDHEPFFIIYHHARRIVNNGIRHKDIILGILKGVVKDEVSNTVIPNALIEIIGTETLIVTNELGEFTIINIPPAVYTLKASIGNYDIKLVDGVIVTANAETELEIKLTPSEA